jgi:hypothetical protein
VGYRIVLYLKVLLYLIRKYFINLIKYKTHTHTHTHTNVHAVLKWCNHTFTAYDSKKKKQYKYMYKRKGNIYFYKDLFGISNVFHTLLVSSSVDVQTHTYTLCRYPESHLSNAFLQSRHLLSTSVFNEI